MYELIILSILIQRPAHGYLIAKAVNNVLGPFAKVNNGRLYPLLSKMQQEGLIAPVEADEPGDEEKGRSVNTVSVTETGRKYFHQLMLDTTSNPSEYQKIFWLKMPVLQFVTPTERLHLLDHYINYCQSHVLHLSAKAREYSEPAEAVPMPPNRLAVLKAIEHRVKHWQLELDWANELREHELA